MTATSESGITIPKIISVDDHVVEPAHLWETWLPEKYKAGHRLHAPHRRRHL